MEVMCVIGVGPGLFTYIYYFIVIIIIIRIVVYLISIIQMVEGLPNCTIE